MEFDLTEGAAVLERTPGVLRKLRTLNPGQKPTGGWESFLGTAGPSPTADLPSGSGAASGSASPSGTPSMR